MGRAKRREGAGARTRGGQKGQGKASVNGRLCAFPAFRSGILLASLGSGTFVRVVQHLPCCIQAGYAGCCCRVWNGTLRRAGGSSGSWLLLGDWGGGGCHPAFAFPFVIGTIQELLEGPGFERQT